jgi:hypothetical protein
MFAEIPDQKVDEIRECHHPHQGFLLDYRQIPDLPLFHELGCLQDIFIGADSERVIRNAAGDPMVFNEKYESLSGTMRY